MNPGPKPAATTHSAGEPLHHVVDLSPGAAT